MDRTLALALRMHDDGTCPCGCGYPRSRAWDEEADGWFEVEEVTCYARKAREEWQERQRAGRKGGESRPGVMALVEDTAEGQ